MALQIKYQWTEQNEMEDTELNRNAKYLAEESEKGKEVSWDQQ